MEPETCLEHADRGAAWLVAQQRPSGSYEGLDEPAVDAYYKAGWAFAKTGRATAAQRVNDHLTARYLTDDGDLEPRRHPSFFDENALYPNAYAVIGSALNERVDVATATVEFVTGRQHPSNGGFYAARGRSGEESRTDALGTAACGYACLLTGRTDAARLAGDFLVDLVRDQPDPDDRFYASRRPNGELATEVEADRDFYRYIDPNAPEQYWGAHVGFPFSFLVHLAVATGEDRYRETVDWLFEYQQRGVDAFTVGSAGKASWGCSVLYRMTGEDRYRSIALDIAADIVGKQNDDGGFAYLESNPYPRDDNELNEFDFDASAECTLWLALVGSNVLAGDGA